MFFRKRFICFACKHVVAGEPAKYVTHTEMYFSAGTRTSKRPFCLTCVPHYDKSSSYGEYWALFRCNKDGEIVS